MHFFLLKREAFQIKTSQELRKAALRVVGCQGVKVFLLKDVIITISVTTVLVLLSQFEFLSCYKLFFFSSAQFEFLSLVTI